MIFSEFLMTSSDEEDDEATTSCRVRNRKLRDNGNILDTPDADFRTNFRMSKECFVQLLNEVGPKYGATSRRTAIPPIIKLATFLRFLASGSYQKAVGNEHAASMSQGRVSRVIAENLNIFEQFLAPKWIRFRMTAEEEIETKRKFLEKFGIPGVIRCVDGTHIKISSPGENFRHLYYNRKGFYSVNALMICDFDMLIRFVDARHPGANHDAYVWRVSAVERLLSSEYENGKRNTWLLGDSGYRLMPYLMTPYREPGQRYETAYNKKLCSARNLIERCFGVLKNRFRCLIGERGLHYSPAMTTRIANACCVLHNICIFHKNYWEIDEEEDVDHESGPDEVSEEIPTAAGNVVRDMLAREITQ